MMGVGNTTRLPLIPLPSDLVLLPGTTLRIPIHDRADVPTLLSKAFSRATQPRNDRYALSVGCIPLRSSQLSRDGRMLLKDVPDDNTSTIEGQKADPARATKNDLFQYGTFGKVIGVQGRPTTEPHLVVEGIRRFRLDHVHQERPFFEAEVTVYADDSERRGYPKLEAAANLL